MSDTPVSARSPSFFDLYGEGHALAEEIDDYVDQWHESADPKVKSLSLHEYLGLSREEYEVWVHFPDALPVILVARRQGRPVSDVMNDNLEEMPVAARSTDAAKVKALREWLETRRKR